MIQYNGITLLRDEDGTPMQVNIDLRVHGTELDAFMRAHGLTAQEQSEMLRSVTGEDISPTYVAGGKVQQHVRYLPEMKRQIQTETDRLFVSPRTRPECDKERVSGLAAAPHRACADTHSPDEGGNAESLRAVLRTGHLLGAVQDAGHDERHLVRILHNP